MRTIENSNNRNIGLQLCVGLSSFGSLNLISAEMASMHWEKLLSKKRFEAQTKTHETDESVRGEFQRDYDRIVFSSAFRRLQNKTQVMPMPESDFVHTRLTHSLEASCVGRS